MLRKVLDISDFVDVKSPERTKANLVARVVKKRKQAKINQAKLSKLSRVSLGSIRRFEQTGEISLSSLIRISSVLQSLEDFDCLFSTPYICDLNKEFKNCTKHIKRGKNQY